MPRIDIYKTVDTFLNHVYKNKIGSYFDIDRHDPNKSAAFLLMEQHNLISYRGVKKTTSYIDLTLVGMDVVEMGGIEKYLNKLQNKEEQREQIDTLTLQKLKFEQIPAKWWLWIALAQIILAALAAYLVELFTE